MKIKKRKGLSIKIVVALYSVIAICVLTAVVVFGGYRLFEKNVKNNYEKYAETVLNYAYTVTSDHAFGDMIAAREMPDEYETMREDLNTIKENSEIEYLYAIYFDDINDIHSLTYAINTKTSEELANGGKYTYLGTICEPGSFEDDTIRILQDAVRSGKTDSAFLDGYSDEYGHMLNGYKVIFDSDGNPAGLLCVEIDINNISLELNRYIRSILIFVVLFTAVIIVIYIAKTEHSIIYPITGVTDAAKDFIQNIGDQDAMDESVRKLGLMNIRSNNEVGELYKTVSKMETDMAKQLRDIRQYNEEILMMQNGLMVLLADMVEIRDSDTGAHIQKTAAYVKIILEGLRRKGYYKDLLTPQYIENVIKSAPLHDVGKIIIPDEVLNKTEKLTDEEYEIMKTHTTSGKAIIEKAISDVEGDSYLSEARNMAAYHHERWDGKGYPEGLHGEEIPLSARVMAVADVFDALTSPRIYKPAFPLSKAVKMIEEGKGIQFDPKCVEVLSDAIPEVKDVLRRLNPDYKEVDE
ncbi:MAG: HD domain-containing protein [Clostridiales bacterium]|nr:HD domain-containing protein [Clostridiales bacterium]